MNKTAIQLAWIEKKTMKLTKAKKNTKPPRENQEETLSRTKRKSE